MASKEQQAALNIIKKSLSEIQLETKCSFIQAKTTKQKATDILQKAIDDLELLQQQKQISDVKKIADNEREMNAIEKINKLEKALDKACEELEDKATNDWCYGCKHQKGNKCEITKGSCYEYCEKEQWKEYLLKESEEQ